MAHVTPNNHAAELANNQLPEGATAFASKSNHAAAADVTPNNHAPEPANNQRPEGATAFAPNSNHAVAMLPNNGNTQAANDTDSLSTLQGERFDVVRSRFHRSRPRETFQPGEYISDETETLSSQGNPQPL